jgi:hypothetical protein
MSRTPHRGATDGGGGPLWDGIALAIHLSEEIGRDALAVMVSVVMGKLGSFGRTAGRVASRATRLSTAGRARPQAFLP